MLLSTLVEGILVSRGSSIKDSLVARNPNEPAVNSQWDVLEEFWLILMFTYIGLSFSLINGLKISVLISIVMSRKFSTFEFASMVTDNPLD